MIESFRGDWQFTRWIRDAQGGGRVEGRARLDARGRFVEEGRWCAGPLSGLRASRVTLWQVDGDGIAVRFEDGRPFHRFGAEDLSPHHDCPPDLYRGRYRLHSPERWSLLWCVTGPSKRYALLTTYRR